MTRGIGQLAVRALRGLRPPAYPVPADARADGRGATRCRSGATRSSRAGTPRWRRAWPSPCCVTAVADPLTIVLLAPASSPHARRWADALGQAGHRVVVASWQPGPKPTSAALRVAPAPGSAMAWRLPLGARWLRHLIRELHPDIVHVHSVGTYGLLSLALPGGPGRPARVVTPWGSELRAARSSPPRAAVARLALRRADLVLPTSAEVAQEVSDRYRVPRQRTEVLSWGVPAELIAALRAIRPASVRSAYGIPLKATVVLSVRSTTATYRVSDIVAAFAQAAAARPDLFLVVLIGHLPQSRSARAARAAYLDRVRAAAAPVAGQVLIIDRVLRPGEVFELMCAADVAVSVPAADQRSSSVLEAALAGCRLLLSDIAPYREMVRDGLGATLLAEPVRRSLAEALPRVRPGDQAAAGDANQAFVRAHEHGAAKIAALEQIYRRVRRPARPGPDGRRDRASGPVTIPGS
jgi:glycosyltransferase involved in cell wall biosynthesis